MWNGVNVSLSNSEPPHFVNFIETKTLKRWRESCVNFYFLFVLKYNKFQLAGSCVSRNHEILLIPQI